VSALDFAIRALRDPQRSAPAAWRRQIEIFPDSIPRPIGTLFAVNGACPLACIYCGLYREMTDRPATGGEIASQIEAARRAMPDVTGLKIYNASSLFEPASIRQTDDDMAAIAASLEGLDFVVVEARAENASRARQLAARISGRLEVAIGLEVADDRILALLNKPTTVARFRHAAEALAQAGISLRSFVLVGPPFVPAARIRPLALKTFSFARDCGSRVVSFLPVRASHAPMRRLAGRGFFSPPPLSAFFDVVAASVDRGPVVLAETDGLAELPACPNCRGAIGESLRSLNELGVLPPVSCAAHQPPVAHTPPPPIETIDAAAEALA